MLAGVVAGDDQGLARHPWVAAHLAASIAPWRGDRVSIGWVEPDEAARRVHELGRKPLLVDLKPTISARFLTRAGDPTMGAAGRDIQRGRLKIQVRVCSCGKSYEQMKFRMNPHSYSIFQRVLHWTVALLICFNLLFPMG